MVRFMTPWLVNLCLSATSPDANRPKHLSHWFISGKVKGSYQIWLLTANKKWCSLLLTVLNFFELHKIQPQHGLRTLTICELHWEQTIILNSHSGVKATEGLPSLQRMSLISHGSPRSVSLGKTGRWGPRRIGSGKGTWDDRGRLGGGPSSKRVGGKQES